LARELNNGSHSESYRVYLGMKHSPPFIAEAVEQMRSDGIESAVGLVLAPHWSGMSVETYIERVEKALAEVGPRFAFVKQWFNHPLFLDFLTARVSDGLAKLTSAERERVALIFSAHSLPTRELPDGALRCKTCDLCPGYCHYVDQLATTAELVAHRVEVDSYWVAWQSAGRTADLWWGPSVEEEIRAAAASGHTGVVVCSAGFVADHLETLYDLDIEARRVAEEAGIPFRRTEMPNADPAFIRALAAVVREMTVAATASAL
jgi:ferrochelatase